MRWLGERRQSTIVSHDAYTSKFEASYDDPNHSYPHSQSPSGLLTEHEAENASREAS